MRRAVFLDRDGVLNERPAPHAYVSRPEDLKLLPGVPEGLRALSSRGFALVVVSNQQGLAKKLLTREALDAIHAKLRAALSGAGAPLLDVWVCPHAETEGCGCRKPAPGLLQGAAARHGLALEQSFLIGDSLSDVAAGRAAGTRTILLAEEPCPEADAEGSRDMAPDFCARSLAEAVAYVLSVAG